MKSKLLFLFFTSLISVNSQLQADEVINACDPAQHARALEQIKQVYNAEKMQFEKSLANIKCSGNNVGCDQVLMSSLTTQYQLKIRALTASYTEQDRKDLCYDFKSSAAIAMASGLAFPTIKNASISVNNQNTNKSISTSSASGDDGWFKIHSPYTTDCANTQAVLTACGSQERPFLSCRAAAEEDTTDFFNNRATTKIKYTEVKCGAPTFISSQCSEVFRTEGSAAPVCHYTEAQWASVKSCFAADKIKERADTCAKGCEGKPTYHVCDWSNEEWQTYSNCGVSLEAKAVRAKLCPESNPGVDSDGPPPRININGHSKSNAYIVDKGDVITISIISVKDKNGSFCIGKIGQNVCNNRSNYTKLSGFNSNNESRLILGNDILSAGDYEIVAMNDGNGKSSSKTFKVTTWALADGPCSPGKWIEQTGVEFAPRAPHGSSPSSSYEGKDCSCTRDPEIKDNSGRRWQCSASALATPSSSAPNPTCVKQKGTFCNEEARLITEWIEYTCPGSPAGTGWTDQKDTTFQRFTTMKCGADAIAVKLPLRTPENVCRTINSGEFCGGQTMTEWVQRTCDQAPEGVWAPQGNNIFHKGSQRPCGNSCAPVKSGSFCGGSDMVEWVELSPACSAGPGVGWNPQGNNLWHKGGGAACSNK